MFAVTNLKDIASASSDLKCGCKVRCGCKVNCPCDSVCSGS